MCAAAGCDPKTPQEEEPSDFPPPAERTSFAKGRLRSLSRSHSATVRGQVHVCMFLRPFGGEGILCVIAQQGEPSEELSSGMLSRLSSAWHQKQPKSTSKVCFVVYMNQSPV